MDTLVVSQPSALRKTCFFILGYTAMAVGIYLLIGGLVNSTSITW